MLTEHNLGSGHDPGLRLREDGRIGDTEAVAQDPGARVDVGVVGHPDDERSGALGRPADLLNQLAH